MSDEDAPERIAITWSPAVRAEVRVIERNAAMQILGCIDDYIAKRTGRATEEIRLSMIRLRSL